MRHAGRAPVGAMLLIVTHSKCSVGKQVNGLVREVADLGVLKAEAFARKLGQHGSSEAQNSDRGHDEHDPRLPPGGRGALGDVGVWGRESTVHFEPPDLRQSCHALWPAVEK